MMQSSSCGIRRTLKGHAGQVTTVKAFELDGGRRLVSGDSVGEVRMWTTEDEKV
jgi:hypothetical protein